MQYFRNAIYLVGSASTGKGPWSPSTFFISPWSRYDNVTWSLSSSRRRVAIGSKWLWNWETTVKLTPNKYSEMQIWCVNYWFVSVRKLFTQSHITTQLLWPHLHQNSIRSFNHCGCNLYQLTNYVAKRYVIWIPQMIPSLEKGTVSGKSNLSYHELFSGNYIFALICATFMVSSIPSPLASKHRRADFQRYSKMELKILLWRDLVLFTIATPT